MTSSLDPRVGHALVCTRAQGLAVPLPNWYCRNRRRARTKKVLGNGVPQPLPKGSPIGQPSEIREAHAAHRRRDRRQHRLNLHRVRDFLDFDAGGSIANTADWLDQLHCIPFMRDVGPPGPGQIVWAGLPSSRSCDGNHGSRYYPAITRLKSRRRNASEPTENLLIMLVT